MIPADSSTEPVCQQAGGLLPGFNACRKPGKSTPGLVKMTLNACLYALFKKTAFFNVV
jgi:hypothetical protein